MFQEENIKVCILDYWKDKFLVYLDTIFCYNNNIYKCHFVITVETEYNHPTNKNEAFCFGKFCNL